MDEIRFYLIYNRRKKFNKDGAALIQLAAHKRRIQKATKRKFFSTNIYVLPEHWDDQKKIVIKHPHSGYLNLQLSEFKASYERKANLIIRRRGDCSLEDLKRDQSSNFMSFIEFVENEIKLDSKSKKEGTLETYRSMLRRLKEYRSQVYFDDLDYDFIQGFDRYLRSLNLSQKIDGQMKQVRMKDTTIGKMHTKLRYFINQSIRKNLLSLNPYSKFKVKEGNPRPKDYPDRDDIEKLENLRFEPNEAYLEKYLDSFLFSVYTGLRCSENSRITLSRFVKRDNDYLLKCEIPKTNDFLEIPISLLFQDSKGDSKPLKLIRKYESILKAMDPYKYNSLPLFGTSTNQVKNRYIQKIAKLAGINKHFSTHSGRTAMAVHLADKIPIHYLQALLGHKKLTTTERYARVNQKNVYKSLKKIDWSK